MPPIRTTPTRRNYLELRSSLERIQEGYELLEQKRQILILELMAQVAAARRIKDQINETMAAAYDALRRAAVRTGITGLRRQNCGITMDHELTYRSHSVMGVPVPDVQCRPAPFGVQFGLTEGRSPTDQVLRRFLEALPLVAELAEVENAVMRLAREIKRTQRRVNALEKTYIPQYKDALKRVEEALAERQREEFIVLRKVKHKRRAAADRRLLALRARSEVS
ncbi:MAG: V-type ATP synthase subunit D [Planctomycetota bacterium]|jgi:V/A-type H+-transporting ATPase subunit D